MLKKLPPVAAALAALAGPLHADIVSTTGHVIPIAPPPSTLATDLSMAGWAYVFQEQNNVYYDGRVDRTNLITLFNYQASHAQNVGYTGVVDCHLIHTDNTGLGDTTPVTGRVTFDGTIVALIFTNFTLDLTDAALGAPGTAYPLGLANRGISSTDFIRLESSSSVYFSLTNGGAMDQIRVLTVPAPAGVLLLASGLPLITRRRRSV